MRSPIFTPKRYQLKKETIHAVKKGHPWVFRDKVSSAAETFADGQWLKLVDSDNSVLGFGVFEPEGLIAIRVFKKGGAAPTRGWLRERILGALAKREHVRKYSTAFRALHGENDGLPGIVFDVYGKLGVLQTYASSVDSLGRYAAGVLAEALNLETVLWKPPAKRKGGEALKSRVLRGVAPEPLTVREGKMTLSIDAASGQKSGAFLDLRNLRKWLTLQNLKNAKVLNLFCYTGTLGLAAETAGATEIWNVDISKGALAIAERKHVLDRKHHRFIEADVFEWVKQLPDTQKFDVIIVDPPSMASLTSQVPQALKTYRKLYASVLPHLKRGGYLVGCCCTSRIPRYVFEKEIDRLLGDRLKKVASLKPEEDHPVGFPEGDYLKVVIYR